MISIADNILIEAPRKATVRKHAVRDAVAFLVLLAVLAGGVALRVWMFLPDVT